MFESLFKEAIMAIRKDELHADTLWNELVFCYNDPRRSYHNLNHLNFMAAALIAVKDNIQDWQTLMLSLAYHDVVYDPAKEDNEEKSAMFADKALAHMNADTHTRNKCRAQILATKSHEKVGDADTNYLLDADLLILGADRMTYLQYARSVRKEYRIYPDTIYNAGRKQLLQTFMDADNIFKTSYFGEKFEEQARKNLLNEIKSL